MRFLLQGLRSCFYDAQLVKATKNVWTYKKKNRTDFKTNAKRQLLLYDNYFPTGNGGFLFRFPKSLIICPAISPSRC